MKNSRLCIRETLLSYSVGTSDKEYKTRVIDLANGLFTVEALWGRRGAQKQSQIKSLAVDISEAKEIQQRLHDEKAAKGYKIEYDDVRPREINIVERLSTPDWSPDFTPLIASHIHDGRSIRNFMDDDSYLVQPHIGGERLIIAITYSGSHSVRFVNRRGANVYHDRVRPIAFALERQHPRTDIVVDGVVNKSGTYFIFDLLKFGDVDLSNETYDVRLDALRSAFVFEHNIAIIPTTDDYSRKEQAIDDARELGLPGIIFRDRFSTYTTDGDPFAFKAPFYRRAYCVIAPARSSSGHDVYATMFNPVSDDFEPVAVVNWKDTVAGLITYGTVAEIKYAGTDSAHNLIDPVLLRIREDVSYAECSLDTLESYDAIASPSLSAI